MINALKNILTDRVNKKPVIAVVGDLMLDEYIWGDVERISPEDPVPVVNFRKKISALGGAANVAANIASLGGQALIFGAVGRDKAGDAVIQKLKKRNIDSRGAARTEKPTIRKIRILGRDKHLLRVDYESNEEIDDKTRNKIFQRLKERLDKTDAIIISDYNKGLFSKNFSRNIINLAKKNKKLVIADFRPIHKEFYKGVNIITPNLKEAFQMAGAPREVKPRGISEAGKSLMKFFNSGVIITQGAEGMTLFQNKNKPVSIPAYRAQKIYDVAGAGDTVAAALAWAMAAGLDIKKASFLANVAGSVAVSKRGTSVVSLEEILASLNPNESKIKKDSELKIILEQLKKNGKKTVLTNGCFDLLNVKHIEFLSRASELGDVLIVAVNSDESVLKIKGPPRPIIKIQDRLKTLAALPEVDYLTVFNEETSLSLVRLLKPDIYVKGGDYKITEIPEAEIVKKYGGKIKLVPKIKGPSTTGLINDIIRLHNLK